MGKGTAMGTRPGELGTDRAAWWENLDGDAGSGSADPAAVVLVEMADGAEASALWRDLRRNGHQMRWCPGPSYTQEHTCPLVTDGRCPLAADADVIVCSPDPPGGPWPAVIQAHARTHPHIPVLVSAPPAVLAHLRALPRGQRLLRYPLTGSALLGALQAAGGRAGRPSLLHRGGTPGRPS